MKIIKRLIIQIILILILGQVVIYLTDIESNIVYLVIILLVVIFQTRAISARIASNAQKPNPVHNTCFSRKSSNIRNNEQQNDCNSGIENQIGAPALGNIQPTETTTRFSDIAGYENTKKSLQFIVQCMKNQEQLKTVGASLPKGILMDGPPGTGKTLFAKAIAGESGIPFFSVDGSQFQDTFVGQGPKNVRVLFDAARKAAPCVVFIDEIDAIGGARGIGDSNSERRNTLNALLVALDGLNSNSGIITIAATNTPDELDPALVRAGRFDRKIRIPLPDSTERKAILEIHCKNKRISQDVSFDCLAEATSGFSGAMLATMANEAALQAAYEGRSVITVADFDTAYFAAMTNGEKKENSGNDLRVVTYHEMGHALTARLLGRNVPFITNVGSTSGVGGFIINSESSSLPTKLDMEKQIMIAYGGRAAEQLINGEDITVGASSDIQKATRIIKQYISTYGMSQNAGMLNISELLGNNADIYNEAKELSDRLYNETVKLLEEHIDLLHIAAKQLMEKKTLRESDLDKIIESKK